MLSIQDQVIALCGTIPPEGGLIAGLFLAGLAGAPLHCGPMCGGFVLGQVADRMAALPAHHLCEWRRVTASALIPYHMGRIITYAGLGAAAGLGGAAIARITWLPPILLVLAAGLFAALAWRRWTGAETITPTRPVPRAHPLPRRPIPALPRSLPTRGLPLGLLLGFLPCGFLYTALTAAAASLDPLVAAAAMAGFGAGTVPTLAAVGIAGHGASRRWHSAMAAAAPFVLIANAALLALLALKGLLA